MRIEQTSRRGDLGFPDPSHDGRALVVFLFSRFTSPVSQKEGIHAGDFIPGRLDRPRQRSVFRSRLRGLCDLRRPLCAGQVAKLPKEKETTMVTALKSLRSRAWSRERSEEFQSVRFVERLRRSFLRWFRTREFFDLRERATFTQWVDTQRGRSEGGLF